MHGLHRGVRARRNFLAALVAACAAACALAFASTGPARAVVSVSTNTITQTAITSPADPSYFYDPTAGAYGSITVSGTTNSTSPASDKVDIDCYYDNGTSVDPNNAPQTLVAGVGLDANGGFTATVPYSAIESVSSDGECTLRAVPAGTTPMTGLGQFSGPRILLSYLQPYYTFGNPSYLQAYTMNVPGLGAIDSVASAGSAVNCGLTMNSVLQQYFGEEGYGAFDCADWFDGPGGLLGGLQVDGTAAQTAWDGPASLAVSASQDPATGQMTISETEPLFTYDQNNFVSLGVQDQRTIQIGAQGKVVLVTDRFSSTDGNPHTVSFDVTANVDDGIRSGGSDLFTFPGVSGGPTAYTTSSTPVAVGGAVPGTIYGYNSQYSGTDGTDYNAITYFNAPSGPIGFYSQVSPFTTGAPADTVEIPFTLSVPAGGSQSLSLAFAADPQQSALGADTADLGTALDLYTPPSVSIASPAAGAELSTPQATVTGSVSAASGVKSVVVNGVSASVHAASFSATVPLMSGPNTLTAVVTTNSGATASYTESVTYTPAASAGSPAPSSTSTNVGPALRASFTGPIWLPIANTGNALRRARGRRELLHATVTSGSGAVSYYFEYGLRGRRARRSGLRHLAAAKRRRVVSLLIGGLRPGALYEYRVVARGAYGEAIGRLRTFRAASTRR